MQALVLVSALFTAQTADIKLYDGSSVAVTVLQSNLEVQTKYGKLLVDLQDIDKIDFGARLHDEEVAKVQGMLRELESANFKDRDTAHKSLIAFHHKVYATLRAHKTESQECRTRLSQIIKHFDDNFSQSELNKPAYDTIYTSEFTIVGVLSGKLDIDQQVFGKHSLSIGKITSYASRRKPNSLVLPAPNADPEWLDTNVTIDGVLTILADGAMDVYPAEPGKYMVGPGGYTTAGKGSSFMAGALIAKIGSGQPFGVGKQLEGNYGAGRLYLQVVPSPWNTQSAGSYVVKITQKR